MHGELRNAYNILVANSKRTKYLVDLEADWRILLKLTLKIL